MANNDHPVLCGGTFLALILQSRKPTATRRQRTKGVSDTFREPDVLLGLVRIVQPDYIKPAGNTFGTYTTNYKKCAIYTPDDLKFDDEAVVSSFLSRVRAHTQDEINRMAAFADQFIDIGSVAGKDILLVKRLIELIRDDSSIPESHLFQIGRSASAVTKKEMPRVTAVCLPAFLLSVWSFIVTERKDNSLGAGTIAAWFPERKDRYAGPDGSTVPQKIHLDSGIVSSKEIETDMPCLAPESPVPPAPTFVEAQDFSREYYNLFVVGNEIQNNRFSLSRDRALTGNSTVAEKYSALDDMAIAQIKTLPAVSMTENMSYGGKTAEDQEAYVGFVTDLKFQENGLIRFRFRSIAKVNQQRLNDIAPLLDIFTGAGVMELNHTHWTIKNVDLIEELIDAGLLPSEGSE